MLHGASGLPEEDLLGAVAAGVVKVNVNAELRRAHLEATAFRWDVVGDDVRALQKQGDRGDERGWPRRRSPCWGSPTGN